MGISADDIATRTRLRELAALFLRLGLTAFGGPAAHIAMMEDEVVRRRKWLTPEEFLDLVGATNLIPGPNSTELAIHIGQRRAGITGLVVAGACFIVPAALLTLGFAWAYVRFGKLPEASRILYGVKPVILAVVLQALLGLGRSALKTKRLVAIGVAAAIAALLRVDELLVLVAAGALAALASGPLPSSTSASATLVGGGAWLAATEAPQALASASSIFLVFAKIGSVLFGSGYVLLAFLRESLVRERHWMTEAQLMDAVAVGQLTPGPVFTTATFAGYVMDGGPGALAATIGIFLPAFVFVALSGLIVPRLRRERRAGAFLDGVNVASLALMAVVTIDLGRASLVDVPSALLALASAALLVRSKVSSSWLVVGGAVIGTLVRGIAR